MSGAIEGSGNIMRAVMAHRWKDASAMQRLGGGRSFAWVFVVPAGMDRPEWMPRSAEPHQLSHGEVAYTWTPKAQQTASGPSSQPSSQPSVAALPQEG